MECVKNYGEIFQDCLWTYLLCLLVSIKHLLTPLQEGDGWLNWVKWKWLRCLIPVMEKFTGTQRREEIVTQMPGSSAGRYMKLFFPAKELYPTQDPPGCPRLALNWIVFTLESCCPSIAPAWPTAGLLDLDFESIPEDTEKQASRPCRDC